MMPVIANAWLSQGIITKATKFFAFDKSREVIMGRREYKAYLLRLWRESGEGGWRATLESPGSGERAGFATLAELVAYLEAKTGESIPVLPADEPSEGP